MPQSFLLKTKSNVVAPLHSNTHSTDIQKLKNVPVNLNQLLKSFKTNTTPSSSKVETVKYAWDSPSINSPHNDSRIPIQQHRSSAPLQQTQATSIKSNRLQLESKGDMINESIENHSISIHEEVYIPAALARQKIKKVCFIIMNNDRLLDFGGLDRRTGRFYTSIGRVTNTL